MQSPVTRTQSHPTPYHLATIRPADSHVGLPYRYRDAGCPTHAPLKSPSCLGCSLQVDLKDKWANLEKGARKGFIDSRGDMSLHHKEIAIQLVKERDALGFRG